MNQTFTGVPGFLESNFISPYANFLNSLPPSYVPIFNIFVYVVLIVIYAIFVFQFYRFLARKNIIKLNLSQYNTSKLPLLSKITASLFFMLEYLVILPALVFSWFVVLSFMLLLLSKDQSVSQILLISAAVVGAVRITSYFKEDLSRDLAKMFPFTVLVIFLLSPNFMSFTHVLARLSEISLFLDHILFYLVFVIGFEILIRGVYTLIFLMKKPEEQAQKEVEEDLKEVAEES